MRRWTVGLALLVTTIGITECSAQARRSAAAGSSSGGRSESAVSADLLSIYDQTRAAVDESRLTAIARDCSAIVGNSQRSHVDRDYAANLLAWALNRRGELRGEQAVRWVAQGRLDEAAAVDRQAADDFETAIRHAPSNWRTHHNFAISLAMKGDYARAIREFTAAIELKSDYANSYFNRGELYFELGQYPQAMNDYNRAIELNASDPQYFNSRAHCRFTLEDYDEAINDYQHATELGPDSAVYHTDLADACQYLGRWDEAATAYRAAVGANNQYARAYQNASWLMATCPEPRIRNVDLALSAAKKAMQLDTQPSAQTFDTLAAATAASGDHPRAVQLQRQALELALADERAELAGRLRLYEQGKSYIQPTATQAHRDISAARPSSPVRAASAP